MPEGDTIYRAARALNQALAGCAVTGFETGLAKLARVHDDMPITGRTVERVESRGVLNGVDGRIRQRGGRVARPSVRYAGLCTSHRLLRRRTRRRVAEVRLVQRSAAG